jgi:hypothetical protein
MGTKVVLLHGDLANNHHFVWFDGKEPQDNNQLEADLAALGLVVPDDQPMRLVFPGVKLDLVLQVFRNNRYRVSTDLGLF